MTQQQPPTGPYAQQYPPQPHGQPYAGGPAPYAGGPAPYAYAPPSSNLAITSLVLGLVGLTVVPLLASIPAIVTGHMARREIAASNGRLQGTGLATAGIITGWIGTGIWILAILFILVVFGSMFAFMVPFAATSGS